MLNEFGNNIFPDSPIIRITNGIRIGIGSLRSTSSPTIWLAINYLPLNVHIICESIGKPTIEVIINLRKIPSTRIANRATPAIEASLISSFAATFR